MGARRHKGLFVALAAAAAAAALIAACARVTPGGVSSPSPLPSRALRPSELTYKANLVERLPEAPQLIFFGGSRSERFDPSYARRVTGLPAFHFSATNARPEAAWAIANWLLERNILLQGLGPRPVTEYRLLVTRTQMRTLQWILLGALPGGILLFGGLVWLVRRR